jgi:hypothetical protein
LHLEDRYQDIVNTRNRLMISLSASRPTPRFASIREFAEFGAAQATAEQAEHTQKVDAALMRLSSTVLIDETVGDKKFHLTGITLLRAMSEQVTQGVYREAESFKTAVFKNIIDILPEKFRGVVGNVARDLIYGDGAFDFQPINPQQRQSSTNQCLKASKITEDVLALAATEVNFLA